MRYLILLLSLLVLMGSASGAEYVNFTASDDTIEGNFTLTNMCSDISDNKVQFGLFSDAFNRANTSDTGWTGNSNYITNGYIKVVSGTSYVAASYPVDFTWPDNFTISADIYGGRTMVGHGTSYDNGIGWGAWPEYYWILYDGHTLVTNPSAGRPNNGVWYSTRSEYMWNSDSQLYNLNLYGNDVLRSSSATSARTPTNVLLKSYGGSNVTRWDNVRVYNSAVNIGDMTSDILDAGFIYYPSAITVTGDVYSENEYSVGLEYRSSTNNNVWSEWQTVSSSVSNGTKYEITGDRYYQVKLTTELLDQDTTPSIEGISIEYSILYPNMVTKYPDMTSITSYENYDLVFNLTLNEPCTTNWYIDDVLNGTSTSTATPEWTWDDPSIGEYVVKSVSTSVNGTYENTWNVDILLNTADFTILYENTAAAVDETSVIFEVSNITIGAENLWVEWSGTQEGATYELRYNSTGVKIESQTATSDGETLTFNVPIQAGIYDIVKTASSSGTKIIITVMITSVIGLTLGVYRFRTKIKTTVFERKEV